MPANGAIRSASPSTVARRRKLRVLAVMHEDFVPPDSVEDPEAARHAKWKTEYDVVAAVHNLGHATRKLGVGGDLGVIREAVRDFEPHVVFNLLEEFGGRDAYVPYVLGYFELLRQAYTGCNPHGVMFATSKPLQKKILRYHRVPTPDFALFPRGRRVQRTSRLAFPLIVKSATAHGSVGIAQASIVTDEEKLKARVEFVHEQLETDAIAEEYIDGRELYVGLIGNRRLMTLPIWEMRFDNLPEGAPRIATSRVKWSANYQEQIGLATAPAELPPEVATRIARLCARAYRALSQTGYARMDLRLTDDGRAYLIESNPNPQLAYGEDFAESAHAAGIGYEALIQRIIALGLRDRHTG